MFTKVASKLLNPGGKLVTEIIPYQPELIRRWFDENLSLGLKVSRVREPYDVISQDYILRSEELPRERRLLHFGPRRAPFILKPPKLADAGASVADPAAALELSHEKGHPRPGLRRLRRHQLRKALRHPRLQRLFRLLQALGAEETHLQVSSGHWTLYCG